MITSLEPPKTSRRARALRFFGVAVAILGTWYFACGTSLVSKWTSAPPVKFAATLKPRRPLDSSGFAILGQSVRPWQMYASLQAISKNWDGLGERTIEDLDHELAAETVPVIDAVSMLISKSECFAYDGDTKQSYATLVEARLMAQSEPLVADEWLATIIFSQGMAALRRGEDENCIMCRGESSCILPINAAAVHQNPEGSRLAIEHFTEYLEFFPDDLEARWLLNLAHMTLGEHPHKVDPQFLVSLDSFQKSEVDIGRFRDIGHLVGINRFNQAGGALLDDFDNDGLLDLVVTSFDPTQVMGFYRNTGDGTFSEQTQAAGLTDQLGGLTCVQTDYNNDGLLDIYIPRGAWVSFPMRPTLLRNEGNCFFTDVTAEAGLLDPVNSNAAMWADYNNDGWLDLFVCCERQLNRLYQNQKDGTFKEVAREAGLAIDNRSFAKGCTWIDYDNDDFPDLFVNNLRGSGQLYHNNRDGTFTNVSASLGIDGPEQGFTCWAWDYDNDGWLDIFAPTYNHTLKDVVKGLIGEPHGLNSNKLYRNLNGQGFRDVAREAGLDLTFATMGGNYGDFDNDGFLDMYLGTGAPSLSTLIPNRMFKNLAGNRFAEVTSSAGVGHLQKGHGVASGDWDRDGDIDIFVEMGGAIPGDKYHNILFQNPGHGHHWLTVKLVGQQTNRAALGARIKVVTSGDQPLTVFRHVSPGSSFGSSPLEQTIGVAKADRIALLEIHWPTSGTTQTFRDIAVNQALEITEFSDQFRVLERPPVVWKN